MTNTKITDPEIMEKRYPVVLNQFRLRPDYGSKGKWKSGDGAIVKLSSWNRVTHQYFHNDV
jgi:5-oxoprolinase (ATP-hydrolysing)